MTTSLTDVIATTHDGLAERLESARIAMPLPQQSRRGCPPIDLFLSEASRHLHAVDEVVVPRVRDRVRDGAALVHDYLHSERDLAVALVHVKAREFGSVYERGFDLTVIWDQVEALLADQRRHEEMLVGELDRVLSDPESAAAALGLSDAEDAAPTRPHPYMPHTGASGHAARGVMSVVDRVWDTLEGRYTRRPVRTKHRAPGLIGQYLLGDPRFGEEESEGDQP